MSEEIFDEEQVALNSYVGSIADQKLYNSKTRIRVQITISGHKDTIAGETGGHAYTTISWEAAEKMRDALIVALKGKRGSA